ncbi:hypothetical protein BMS3Abin06_00170 [bacterium BMS3Abin06]|nr:hypothetical protein BMS3Abin06_00170 [bacterium BMS3Abin06]
MNTEFANPFLESTLNILSTMAMLEAKPGKSEIKSDDWRSFAFMIDSNRKMYKFLTKKTIIFYMQLVLWIAIK